MINFVVNKAPLTDAVRRIIDVCKIPKKDSKTALPYFFHIRFDGLGECLKLSANNGYRYIEILVAEVSAHEPFCFGVSGGYFFELLEAFPDDVSVTFYLNHECRISIGSSTLKLKVLDAKFFPELRVVPSDLEWMRIDGNSLFEVFRRIIFCYDKEGRVNKNYTKAICITPEYLLCTDNWRISLYPNTFIPCTKKALLPIECVPHFSTLFNPGDIFIHIDEGEMHFSQGPIYANTRLLVNDSPNFKSVLSTSEGLVCAVDRGTLLSALKRALIVAQKGEFKNPNNILVFHSNIIRFNVNNGGDSIEEAIPCKYDGPHFPIDLDLLFLFQAVKYITDNVVIIVLNSDLKPVVITDSERRHVNVIMPRTVRS